MRRDVVIISGSVEWWDPEPIENRLHLLSRDVLIVHGDARGADKMAGSIAKRLGFDVRPEPAKWREHGEYNPKAGLERDVYMLDHYDPVLVIGFSLMESSGTAYTLAEAKARGIATEKIVGVPKGQAALFS